MAGLHAADGSINVTVVDGTSVTGLYAADGSWNVVLSDGSTPVGMYHPCGAFWVTVAPTSAPVPFHAPDGSLYVSESPYTPTGALRVTAVTGDLTPGGGVIEAGNPMGLLLALTYAA